MKKTGLAAMLICAVLLLGSCGRVVQGSDGMLAYAREKHGEALVGSGTLSHGKHFLAWFTMTDPSKKLCIPCAFVELADGFYQLTDDINTFLNADACACKWQDGIAIHIEDKTINEIVVTCEPDDIHILVDTYPYNYFLQEDGYKGNKGDIKFLDKDDNVLTEI
ncbi:MAG: hypothetical protein IJT87_09740 [Ruminiclostridium sp.]|nr:hypothetical protein [Ruminiclostridium sp.]